MYRHGGISKQMRRHHMIRITYKTSISNIEHNYITKSTAIFTQHWDSWKGGGQKNNLIVVHPNSIKTV